MEEGELKIKHLMDTKVTGKATSNGADCHQVLELSVSSLMVT
jgi:hypothetical protein